MSRWSVRPRTSLQHLFASRAGGAFHRSSQPALGNSSQRRCAETRDQAKGDSPAMVTGIKVWQSRLTRLARGIRSLLGVGMHLLLIALCLEALAVVVRHRNYWPIRLTIETQILLTVVCLATCLLSAIWFNRSLNLIRVHLLDGEDQLVTCGPFAYVRQPLYASLVMTIPPLVIVWLSDLLFLAPWFLILLISHLVARIEERALVEAYGTDYVRYQRSVHALLPYKGASARRFRDSRSRPPARDSRLSVCVAAADLPSGGMESGNERARLPYGFPSGSCSIPVDG